MEAIVAALWPSSAQQFIFNVNCLAILLSSLLLITLVFGGRPAPYGRYLRGDSLLWRRYGAIHARLAWHFQTAPCVFVPIFFFALGAPASLHIDFELGANRETFLLGCFWMHYLNRAFLYPNRISVHARPIPTPFVVMVGVFTTLNSLSQIVGLAANGAAATRSQFDLVGKWHVTVGVVLFAVGYVLNQRADATLCALRKGDEKGYRIPYGLLFRYVSCANYTAETLEWLGYALACWNLSAFTFFYVTVCNLGPRAVEHHKWYKEKFGGEYPEDRRAYIPFIL